VFDFLKKNKKTEPRKDPLRDALFADMSLSVWSGKASAGEPAASFTHANDSINSGALDAARTALRKIVDTPGLESRHYLQAWNHLRSLGVNPPPEKAKDVIGFVMELPFNNGVDLLAAYTDHIARYYNHGGAKVIWERPTDRLDKLIDNLFAASRNVVQQIGPWTEPRRLDPPEGYVRINFLTPGGLHFGEGPQNLLTKDPLAGPVLAAAFPLMKAMMDLLKK
jgi:hypothetical protein